MDYARVYREFIADRKAKPKPQGYTERHHIIPLSLGGGNEAANLIDLTAEDHIFAHILLAKAHGGTMWAPVSIILGNGAKTSLPTRRAIRLAALARQKHGEAMRGCANPFFGKKHSEQTLAAMGKSGTYTLRSASGDVSGTRRQLLALTGLCVKSLSSLLTGRHLNVGGWFSPDHNPLGLTKSELLSLSIRNATEFKLFHHGGKIWTGTAWDFRNQFGRALHFRSANGHCAGWYLDPECAAIHLEVVSARAKRTAAARGSISGEKNPMFGADRRKDMVVKLSHKNGDRFDGSLKELADHLNWDSSQYRQMKLVVRGKRVVAGCAVKTFKGWRLAA